MNTWDEMTNEQLVTIYQQTKDNSLYEYFLERNKGLMFKFINYYNKKVSKYVEYTENVEQIGMIAMWEAMNDFKPEFNTKFSTLYFYYIKKQLNEHIRTSHVIRIPAYVLEDIKKYLDEPDGRILRVDSLDESAGYEDDPDITLADLVASDEPNPEEILMSEHDRNMLDPLLSNLKPREEYVVRLWLGLDIDRPRTLQECGDLVGVSRERIRQIVAKAIKRLRIYAPRYYDVAKYDPNKNEYHDKPSTQIRNDGNLRKRSK